jgi:hypothetical protein
MRGVPLVSLLLSGRPDLRAHLPTVVLSLLVVIPYVVVLIHLEISTVKRGLPLAVGWATINLLVLLAPLLTGLRIGKPTLWTLLGSLVQVVLVSTALAAYLGMRREPEDVKRLILGFVIAVCYFALMNFIVGLSL